MDLELPGAPRQAIEPARPVRRVALVGSDYIGVTPSLKVAQGDRVSLGQTLFTDRREPRVRFTSPGSGHIAAIRHGSRRRLLAIEIELGDAEPCTFAAHHRNSLRGLGQKAVREQLLASGLWIALRARPFDHVPAPDDVPRAVLVTALSFSISSCAPCLLRISP